MRRISSVLLAFALALLLIVAAAWCHRYEVLPQRPGAAYVLRYDRLTGELEYRSPSTEGAWVPFGAPPVVE